MRNNKKWLVFLLCAIVLLNTVSIRAAAVENESPLAISVPEQVAQGAFVEVQIQATEGQTIADGKLILTYDAGKLGYQPFTKTWSDQVTLSVNPAEGKIILAFASAEAAEAGALFTLRFIALEPGTASVAIDGSSYLTGIDADLSAEASLTVTEPVTVLASGWSGYTTWKLTSDGTLTFTPTEQKYDDGQTNLKNYWKVNGVLTLPWTAYADQITKVVIEEGIHDIGQMAFYELPNLQEVVLPDSAVEIRNYAFKNCKSLTTINLEVVEYIREGAFYGCTALEEVNLAEGVVIEDWAFSKVPGYTPAN